MKNLLITLTVLSILGCDEEYNKRMAKDQISSNVGLNRTLEVYSLDGKLIKTYNGQFDIECTDGGKIKFDVDGKRHILYNALVICDEK